MNEIYINGRFLTQKTTGVQRFAFETLKSLAAISKEENVKIVLLCPHNAADIKIENVRIIKIGLTTGYFWEQITLANYCKKHKIKGLLNLCNLAPIRLKRTNIVIHDTRFIERPQDFNFLYRSLLRFFTKRNLKNAANIFTVSNFSKNSIERIYNAKNVMTIYSGVDHIKTIDTNEMHADDYYLCVGSLEPNKNFKFILDFAKKRKDIKFKIIGGKSKTFSKVEYECLSNVEFLGYLSDEKLHFLYCNAKGFVFPSLYEGFGLPPLEAIALGIKTVCASNIEVLHEIYGNTLTYFDPEDLDSLTKAIDMPHIITSEERQRLLGKYTWSNTASAIYSKIKPQKY